MQVAFVFGSFTFLVFNYEFGFWLNNFQGSNVHQIWQKMSIKGLEHLSTLFVNNRNYNFIALATPV